MKRQCSAHLSDGSGRRCRLAPIRGGTVCHKHGAGKGSPAARSARERLDALAEPAIAALSVALDRVEVHPQLALHAGIQRAITTVLDRTGYPRATKLEIEQHQTRISEAQGEQLARVLVLALDELGLDRDDREVRRALAAALLREAGEEPNGHRRPAPPPPAPPPVAPPREPERMIL